MLAVAFDTLKLARKLESAGMQSKQAQDTSAADQALFAVLEQGELHAGVTPTEAAMPVGGSIFSSRCS